jgi:predicted DCC family thiol-disulfide oxidoreductase YuxK
MREVIPAVPVMIYDGDCEFCKRWRRRWQRLTGDAIEYAPYQEALERFPQVSRESAEAAVQLVLPGGEVLSGAAAVCRTLRDVRGWGWANRAYWNVSGFRLIAEALYRLVARNRLVLSWLMR